MSQSIFKPEQSVDQFHIRPYQPADLEQIKQLILGIQQGEFDIPIHWEDQPDLHDIPAFYRRGFGQFWSAETDGKIVGTIALIDIGSNIGVIRKMFVAAEWRGKQIGAAQQLLNVLLAHARAKNLLSIFLGTIGVYHAARRFYERNGFNLIDPAELPPSFPRMAVDTHFYRLNLA